MDVKKHELFDMIIFSVAMVAIMAAFAMGVYKVVEFSKAPPVEESINLFGECHYRTIQANLQAEKGE